MCVDSENPPKNIEYDTFFVLLCWNSNNDLVHVYQCDNVNSRFTCWIKTFAGDRNGRGTPSPDEEYEASNMALLIRNKIK